VDPHVIRKSGLRVARCTNDQRHRCTWGESILDPVTVEDQNAVIRFSTSHTGGSAGIEPVDPHLFRKPGPRDARYTNDQFHWNMWEPYMTDSKLFEGQNAVFGLPTIHTGFLAGIRPVDPHVFGNRAASYKMHQ